MTGAETHNMIQIELLEYKYQQGNWQTSRLKMAEKTPIHSHCKSERQVWS